MHDDIEAYIKASGFIPNNNLWRRWVSVQMERHLSEFDKYFFERKPYTYVWMILLKETKFLRKIEKSRNLTSVEKKQMITLRENLINKKIIIEIFNDYEDQTKSMFDQKTTELIQKHKTSLQKAKSYSEIEKIINHFLKTCPIPKKLREPDVWKSSFKKIGTYHTIDNMIKFDNHCFSNDETKMSQTESLNKLNNMLKQNNSEQLFSEMEKLMKEH